MKRCWIVVITRGLSIWIPPELYLTKDLAEQESARWRAVLRLPRKPPTYSPNVRYLQLEESLFPEPWRACPVWAGVTWNSQTFPRLQLELLAADEDEAADWLTNHLPRDVIVAKPGQLLFERGGVTLAAGILRVKRVLGV